MHGLIGAGKAGGNASAMPLTELIINGQGTTDVDRALSVRNIDGVELLGVRGDDMTRALNFTVDGLFYADAGNIYTSGEGDLHISGYFSAAAVATGFQRFHSAFEANDFNVPNGHLILFQGQDGKLHYKTADGVDYIVSSTVAP